MQKKSFKNTLKEDSSKNHSKGYNSEIFQSK